MSKGDNPRPVNKKVYDENFLRVFGPKKLNVWEDPPRVGDDDQPDGGQAAEVFEEPGGRADPKVAGIVEGSGCPCCPGGKIIGDSLWTERIMCDKCNSNWEREGQ